MTSQTMLRLDKIGGRSVRSKPSVEARIANRLRSASKISRNYWDFRQGADSVASECLFQYPAMMVPALQKQVIAAILTAQPDIKTIADPFLGSGTIMALAMLSGRGFIGQDVNPLAILIAKTRAFSLHPSALTRAIKRIKLAAAKSRSTRFAIHFKRQSKWLTRGASIGLSRLRRAIRAEKNIKTRRFLWVCLAETVRLNSNSRTSTYKLHVKPESKRTATIENILSSFSKIAEHNIDVVKEFRSALLSAQLLNERGNYKGRVQISYGNTADQFPPGRKTSKCKYEIVVTSPPYGDNRTTVPYGQAAWLPLQWINFRDIDMSIPKNAAKGYYDVDNVSLGGRRSRHFAERQKGIESVGERTQAYAQRLKAISRDGLSRFVNFVFDLRNAIKQFVGNCKKGGYIVLTLGNRNICGTVCPLTDVCAELLSDLKAKEIVRISRQIPSKRMPGKNGHSATINQEHISLFHKVTLSKRHRLNDQRSKR